MSKFIISSEEDIIKQIGRAISPTLKGKQKITRLVTYKHFQVMAS
jgi:hypothetical protein